MPPRKHSPTHETQRGKDVPRTHAERPHVEGPFAGDVAAPAAGTLHPFRGLETIERRLEIDEGDGGLIVGKPRIDIDAAVANSLEAVSRKYEGKARDARKKVGEKGFSDTLDSVTTRLRRTSTDPVTALILTDPDVYGALVIDALDKDKVKSDDPTGLYNAILRRAERPRLAFESALVESVLSKNHIAVGEKSELRSRVVEIVHEDGIPLESGQAEDAILGIYRRVVAEGDLPVAIDDFAHRNQISTLRLTDDVKQSMVDYLRSLGIPISLTRAKRGEYDEYFAMAYDRAVGTGDGRSDPIALSRPQGFVTAWDFQVDTFETADQQAVIKENILAAGALDYVYNLGELLGVYKLADALVLNWAAGAVDIVDSATSQRLYRYWKVREDRMSPEERQMLYKRVLNKGDTDVLSKMVVNTAFPTLWDNLMQEVANYVQATADAAKETNISRKPIEAAVRELQYNLTEFMTGMAHMQVTEMYAQLKDAMTLLGSSDVTSQLSGGRRRTVWAVIANLSKQELGTAPDVAAIRTLAVDGNQVFQAIGKYTPGGFSDPDFQNFLDSAEAWILAAASIGDYQPPGEKSQDQQQDDFSDDEFKDSESDWNA